MSFFDFSDDVWRAVSEARDLPSRLSARTTVHRAKFLAAVRKAGFHLLSRGSYFTRGKHDVVIGAAPWSDPDLAALEDLALHARSGATRISVFDIDDIPFPEMVTLLPGIRMFTRTPVVMQYRNGELAYFGQGHDAVLWLRQL
jgi:hypothetical protein